MSASKKKKVERTSAARAKTSGKSAGGRAPAGRGDEAPRARASGSSRSADAEKADAKVAPQEEGRGERRESGSDASKSTGDQAVPQGAVKTREPAPAPRGNPPALPIPLATFTV